MMKFNHLAIAGVAAAALTLVGAASAQAVPDAQTYDGAMHVVSETSMTSRDCVSQIMQAMADGDAGLSTDVCTGTVTLSSSDPLPITASDIAQAKQTLAPEQYQDLVSAVTAGTVRKKAYSQSENNITDGETQYGNFYYDGSRAWVTSAYRGFTGTHICKIDWAVGYAVSNTGCFEGGTNSRRDLYAKWYFGVGVKGSPIAWEETYSMHVNAAGSIWQ